MMRVRICFDIDVTPEAAFWLRRGLREPGRADWLRYGLAGALEAFLVRLAGGTCGIVTVTGGTVTTLTEADCEK